MDPDGFFFSVGFFNNKWHKSPDSFFGLEKEVVHKMLGYFQDCEHGKDPICIRVKAALEPTKQ